MCTALGTAEGSCVLLHLCSPGHWGFSQLSLGTRSVQEQNSPLAEPDLGIKAALCLFLQGAVSLLRDWRLLLHGGGSG